MIVLKSYVYTKNPYYGILKNCWNTINCNFFFAVLPAMFLINSCASTDQVRDWRSSEDYDQSYKKVLIMGLVNKVSLRTDIEYEVTDAARKAGLKAVNSMSMFPPQLGNPFDDLEHLKTTLREKDFDGILTVSFIDVSEERYVGPNTEYIPLVYYDRFSNYYYRTRALVYKPGYSTLQTRYFLETNLYELKVGKLVWSGRSFAFDAGELESIVPKYANRLFKKLQIGGIIAK